VEERHEDAPIYSDRMTGRKFENARQMVDAYLERYSSRAKVELQPLDATGYTQTRQGSATIGVNVLEDHGILFMVSHVMPVPKHGREALYRRLLELSFLSTSDASFSIDADKEEIFVRAVRRLSGLDYEEFEDLLETVGRVADQWDDVLKREFPA